MLVSGFWTMYCWLHLPPRHHTAALVDAAIFGVQQQKLCIMAGWKRMLCALKETCCICLDCRKTCMPMMKPYCRSLSWLPVGPSSCSYTSIHHMPWLWLIVVFGFCLWAAVHTFNQLTFLFGVIDLVYTLHLRHFCWCYCYCCLIDCHRVVALYSFNQKFVWVRSIVLLFSSSRRPFVFIVKTSIPSSIVILFLSWSRRCHRCGPIDRCFVLIVESYVSHTRLHHIRSIIRSFCLHVRACVFVVVVVDSSSSWFLFPFVRVSEYVAVALSSS